MNWALHAAPTLLLCSYADVSLHYMDEVIDIEWFFEVAIGTACVGELVGVGMR